MPNGNVLWHLDLARKNARRTLGYLRSAQAAKPKFLEMEHGEQLAEKLLESIDKLVVALGGEEEGRE